ncbi:MAG: glutamate dehydrogenase, partial [Limisphaerales bacterium]
MDKNNYIEAVMDRLSQELPTSQLSLVRSFTELFWMRTLDEDLLSRSIEEATNITLDCWRRLDGHSGDKVGFLLSNPSPTSDDLQASRTVVQVTAPNMPFMVDSVLMALSHDGLITHLLTNVVFAIQRAEDGAITDISSDLEHANRELLVYAEIDRLDDSELQPLYERLESMARELQAVVADYGPMKQVIERILHDLKETPPPLPPAEIEEGTAFLEWMLANHFTFLGYREFAYHDDLIRQVGSALGMLRVRSAASERSMADQPLETREFLLTPALLTFSKSGTKSQVHRPAYPDYVGIKRFDAQGNVIGEIGFLGLYTSRVYKEFPERIPHVRQKVARVVARSGLDPNGFDGKVLAEVLATYPRDELLQISEQALYENAMVITDIHERRRVRVFPRYDAYGLFVTVLVFMPRDLFNTQVRLNLQDLLMTTFSAEDADYDAYLSESILVRLQYNLRIGHGSRPHVDRIDLEHRIVSMIGDWASELNAALLDRFGAAKGRALKKVYHDAFPAGYREEFATVIAVDDIAAIEAMGADVTLSTRFYRDVQDPENALHLKIYHFGEPLPLSDVIPKLENMGLRIYGEHPYAVSRDSQPEISVHDFELEFDGELDLGEVNEEFDSAFVRAWRGELEDDGYNRLILTAGLTWRQISVLRAYAQYMKQIRFGFSQAFISDTLDQHRTITADLIEYFELKFDPNTDHGAEVTALHARMLASFEGVALLNEDRVLRKFLELLDATQRTNYFRTNDDGQHRPFIALKFAPAEIANMPRPVPLFEIFVSSADFEGLHLRGGPIARGGLRWSDRREDFRTEVLGLVKAQVVKNAVIVPTGAKGGFVLKGAREGVDCYRDFIRGLLDTTDNIIEGEVVRPPDVKALDADDPYLVVAA